MIAETSNKSKSVKSKTKAVARTMGKFAHVYPVILAGGSGIRLWPESQPDCPKQFLRVSGRRTMLEETYRRIAPMVVPDHLLVVTARTDAKRVRQSLPKIAPNNILAEPVGRNTAPAIGLAAFELLERDPDAIMVVLPSDHVVEPVSSFRRALGLAVHLVQHNPNQLAVFGISPEYPATQFGYIEINPDKPGPSVEQDERNALSTPRSPVIRSFAVASFHEKPDRKTASRYLKKGRFYWNSGMFVWRADRIVELLERFEPELVASLKRIFQQRSFPDFTEILNHEYSNMKKIPIDRAVLERSSDLSMVEAPFEWDDLGSFDALAARDGHTDTNGNTITGKKIVLHNAARNIVRQLPDQKNPPLVALLGVDDLIVVQTQKAILVCKKEEQANIPELLQQAGISFDSDHDRRG